MHLLRSSVALVLLGGVAQAQAFNIDFGSAAFGAGTPGSTYGAGAGSVGAWNNVDTDLFGAGVYTSPVLMTTGGAVSTVYVDIDPLGLGLVPFEANEPNTTGDDQALFDDCYFNGGPSSITVYNLAPGTYAVYTYAMAPDSALYFTSVDVTGSTDPLQPVGGDFSAGFQLGVTHALHHVTVVAGTPLMINLDVSTTYDSINGLQIVPSGPGGVGTNYCAAVPNSTGNAGAIYGTGSALVNNNDLTLHATDLPLNAFGFFLTSRTQGLIPNPGGSQGNLCLGSPIGRYVGAGQIKNSGATGEFSLLLDLTQTPTPTGLIAISAGESWYFQAWHRDAVGGVATSNFTDGLCVAFL